MKKGLAIILMVLAIIGVVASLTGVIGVWIGAGQLTREALAGLAELEGDLQAVDGAFVEIGPRVKAAGEGLDAISATAGGAGDRLGEPKAVELAQTVRDRLSEIESRVQDADGRLDEVELRINGLLTTVNKLPGVQVPPLDVKVLDDLGGLLTDAGTGLQDLADTVTGGKASVVGEMQTVERSVMGVRGDLTALEESIAQARARVSADRALVAGWRSLVSDRLQRAAAFFTAALIWFALGQVGLFMWGWSIYRSAQRGDGQGGTP